jgi:hypothetical protein
MRTARSLFLLVVVSASLGALPAAARADTFTAPGFVRSIGARGEAGVYAWGMAYNPVSNEILVGDYWNFKIRRYDLEGNEVGAFYRSPKLYKGQPYSISVDSRNGDIYVSEISDGKEGGWFARYDVHGNYLSDFQSGARYTAWHTADTNGYLYVADSHYWNKSTDPPKIRKYNLSTGGTQVMSFGSYGTGPGQMGIIHGLAVDAAGRIYAADAVNRRVSVYSPAGTFLYSFGSQGTGVGQFTGDLRGMALDQQTGAIYVVDAEAAEIEEFQMSADPATTPPTPVAHWGSEGQGPGQFADGGRAITIDAQHDLWVADYGNFRFFRYSPTGTLLATYPAPAQDPVPGGFAQVRDVAVAPDGTVWAADTWNNRFQRFAPDGTFQATFGRRNSHPPYGMDYPRGIAVDPATGEVWVSSTRDHFIRVYDATGTTYLRTIGSGADSTAAGSFRWPMDVEFAGGSAWVADYTSCRLKQVDAATGAELLSVSVCNNGVAIDPTTGNIFVVSWKYDRVSVYSSSGALIRTWGTEGSGSGQFENPWDIDIVNLTPGGAPTYRVLVTDSQLARVEVFDLNGGFIGQWGTKGSGVFQLSQPSGITHDTQGNIYVADAANDRIQVFSFAKALPAGDATPPSAAIASPAKNQVLDPQTVMVRGTAADDTAVGTVAVSVRDISTGRYWNALDAVWGTPKMWNLAGYAGASTTSVTFGFGFVGVGVGRSYVAQTRVTDTSGNSTTGVPVPFSTGTGAAPDTVRPTGTVLVPVKDAVLPAGTVTISGQAIDDVAVASVEIAIKDRTAGLWWNPGTGTWGSLKWMPVALGSPGATATTWTAGWAGGTGGGAYFVQARVTDTAGNQDAVHSSSRFTEV